MNNVKSEKFSPVRKKYVLNNSIVHLNVFNFKISGTSEERWELFGEKKASYKERKQQWAAVAALTLTKGRLARPLCHRCSSDNFSPEGHSTFFQTLVHICNRRFLAPASGKHLLLGIRVSILAPPSRAGASLPTSKRRRAANRKWEWPRKEPSLLPPPHRLASAST